MRSGRSKVKTQEPKPRADFQSIEEALGSRNEHSSLISQIVDDVRDSAGENRLLTVHISTPEELRELANRDGLTIVMGQPIYCRFEEGPDEQDTYLVRICDTMKRHLAWLERFYVKN